MGKNLRLFNLCTFFLWVSWISYSSSTSANIPSTNYIHYTMCIYIVDILYQIVFRFSSNSTIPHKSSTKHVVGHRIWDSACQSILHRVNDITLDEPYYTPKYSSLYLRLFHYIAQIHRTLFPKLVCHVCLKHLVYLCFPHGC